MSVYPPPVTVDPRSPPAVAHRPFQVHATRAAPRNRIPGWGIVFVVTAILYLMAGWYITISLGVYHNDAISRTALASFAIQSRDPHLSAIGFVWNPLPSLVQIPVLLVLRPVGLQQLAGPLQSALAMAASAALLWQFFGLYPVAPSIRVLLISLFATNPMVMLYAANGMSEPMFFLFIIGTAYYFIKWARGEGYSSLVSMALMTAGAFGVRYETFAILGAGSIALIIASLAGRTLDPPRLEATLLAYLSPICYAILLWMLFNQIIMGDALFFQRSVYSNTQQTADFIRISDFLSDVVGSPLGSTQYAAVRAFAIFPAFAPVILGAIAVVVIQRHWQVGCLIILAVSVLVFHTYLIYCGSSFGWLRFFMYSIVATFLLLPSLLSSDIVGRSNRLTVVILSFILVTSSLSTLWTMSQPQIGREEFQFVQKISDRDATLPNSRTYRDERAVAQYVDDNLQGELILIDTFLGFAVPLFADDPRQFVITSDRDFEDVVAAPAGKVGYMLVPPPVGYFGQTDRINARYPRLYAGGEDWVVLAKEFGGEAAWRLYRVLPGSVDR